MADPADVVTALLAEARRAWPAIAIADDLAIAHLAPIVAAAEVPAAELRAAELYLAAACCAGDAAALVAFEQLLAPVRGTLQRAGYDPALVDDALQTVRYRVLVATPERAAKLTSYRGRGSLGGWLRVVALRQIRDLAGPRRERSDSALAAAVADGDGTLAVLARTHGPAIRRMFRDALGALDARQRALLRLEIVDGLPHQRIAELHGVHRTTALRWIDEARELLAREVRRGLKRELGLGDDSADSLLRALAGQVDLSLGSSLISAE